MTSDPPIHLPDRLGERGRRMPWAITAAALISFIAIYFTGRRFIGVPILACLLLAAQVTRRRIGGGALLGWTVRAGVFTTIALAVGMPQEDSSSWYFKPEYTNLVGYLLAAELVIQAWRWRDWSRPPEALGVAVLLTALIMAAASDTYQRAHFHYLAPAYCLALVLALRSFGRRANALPAADRTSQRGLAWLRGIVVILTLAAGYAGVEGITRYDYRITSLAMRWINRRPPRRREIGLSDMPRLQAVFNPLASAERVLLIDGRPWDAHLRAMAFDTYENQIWRPGLVERQLVPIDPGILNSSIAGSWLRCTPLQDDATVIAAPLSTGGVRCESPLLGDETGLMTAKGSSGAAYQILPPQHQADQGPLCIRPSADRLWRLLRVPDDIHPRVVELSRRVAGSGAPAARVARLAAHLRQTHAYSLVFKPVGEPLNDFILNGRAAHCEYFASAMVVMARAAGIPARYVSGYYAHEYRAGQTVVRSQDAHAWAECYFDGAGWITVDPTPADGRPDALFPQPTAWRLWRERLMDLPRRIREALVAFPKWTAAVAIGAATALAYLARLLRTLIIRARRRRTGRRGITPPVELALVARRFERLLRRRGIPPAEARTWQESVGSAKAGIAAADRAACLRFIDAYNQARFGGEVDLPRVTDALRELEEA